MRLTGGDVLLDQSMLTGESVSIEAGADFQTFAGALVRRGEAMEVTATGPHTKFGRTAELVRTAHVVSSEQKAVLRVVRNLAVFNGVVIALLVAYAYSKDAAFRHRSSHTNSSSGIDPGRIAGNLHSCLRAWRSGLSKTRRVADASLSGG
jgi:cation transport ATPase